MKVYFSTSALLLLIFHLVHAKEGKDDFKEHTAIPSAPTISVTIKASPLAPNSTPLASDSSSHQPIKQAHLQALHPGSENSTREFGNYTLPSLRSYHLNMPAPDPCTTCEGFYDLYTKCVPDTTVDPHQQIDQLSLCMCRKQELFSKYSTCVEGCTLMAQLAGIPKPTIVKDRCRKEGMPIGGAVGMRRSGGAMPILLCLCMAILMWW
ncbi:uncharacterized protein VTP21DRAFT_53 [Calcarisporiella thermophila]|uniref:uncharacterized protein n=1 Tax=Calcarisporiella thermophila TaxID=911321 RepID=UPI0037436A5A